MFVPPITGRREVNIGDSSLRGPVHVRWLRASYPAESGSLPAASRGLDGGGFQMRLLLAAVIFSTMLYAAERPVGFVAGGSGKVNGQKAVKSQAVFSSDRLEGPLTVKERSGAVREIKPKNPNAVSNVCDNVAERAREHAASPSVPALCSE